MIGIFDTSVSSLNLGDQIIMESSDKILNEIFSNEYAIKIASHNCICGSYSKTIIKQSRCVVFCGTNAISSSMIFSTWAKIKDFFLLKKKVVLLGVGWGNYSNGVSLYSRIILKRFLSDEYIHSVRDEYTKNKLKSIGIENVINTGCPTLWGISEEHCKAIPLEKTSEVIFTLTTYNKCIEEDIFLIHTLVKNYSKLYFRPQQPGDYEYLCKIFSTEAIEVLKPNLAGLEDKLSESNVEYVGTRLHAGIKAIQKGKRAIIVGIDNRALEMGKDFNLNVIKRSDLKEKLHTLINTKIMTQINIDADLIKKWKEQFS